MHKCVTLTLQSDRRALAYDSLWYLSLDKVISNNACFCHPENLLAAMLADDRYTSTFVNLLAAAS